MAGYIGNFPTPVPLTSADLADSIITSAKIVDGAIVGDDINSTFNLTGKTVTLPAGVGGKVLQVVMGTTSTQTTISTTVFTDTNLTATITPTNSSNKILVLISQQTHFFRTASDARGAMKLVRSISGGSSTDFNLYVGSANRSAGGMRAGTDATFGRNELTAIVSMNYLDSPSTTSAVTYKTQARPAEAGSDMTLQYDSSTSQIVLIEIEG
jgi:hypothetical protein